MFAGCLLGACWVFAGCLLGACWVLAGCLLGVCWVFAGCLLGVCWGSARGLLEVCWVFAGCLLGALPRPPPSPLPPAVSAEVSTLRAEALPAAEKPFKSFFKSFPAPQEEPLEVLSSPGKNL